MNLERKAKLDELLPQDSQENLIKRRWLISSKLPMRFWQYELAEMTNLEDTDTPFGPADPVDVVKGWVKDVLAGKVVYTMNAKGLLLWGEPGHGKTTLACLTLLDILLRCNPEKVFGHTAQTKHYVTGYYTPWQAYMENKKRLMHLGDETDEWGRLDDEADIVEARVHKMAAKILVLDDVGKEYRTSSGYASNQMEALVRHRLDLGLPTIVTTNVEPDKWASTYGASMESFAREAFHSVGIVNAGGDQRGKDR